MRGKSFLATVATLVVVAGSVAAMSYYQTQWVAAVEFHEDIVCLAETVRPADYTRLVLRYEPQWVGGRGEQRAALPHHEVEASTPLIWRSREKSDEQAGSLW